MYKIVESLKRIESFLYTPQYRSSWVQYRGLDDFFIGFRRGIEAAYRENNLPLNEDIVQKIFKYYIDDKAAQEKIEYAQKEKKRKLTEETLKKEKQRMSEETLREGSGQTRKPNVVRVVTEDFQHLIVTTDAHKFNFFFPQRNALDTVETTVRATGQTFGVQEKDYEVVMSEVGREEKVINNERHSKNWHQDRENTYDILKYYFNKAINNDKISITLRHNPRGN